MSKRNSNKREGKRKSRALRKVLLLLLLLLILLIAFIAYRIKENGGGMQGLLSTLVGHNAETLENLDKIQVLVMGVSTDNGGKLTDTIIVGTYDPKTQHVSLLSIPRDTFVGKNEATASAYDKINALYQKSPEKTLEAVNSITGLDLKYYVVIDNQALIKLVDVIGGVEFEVPYVPGGMVYDDPSQDLHINLQSGMQLIDGEKAEQLLRYRHGNPDKNGKMTTYPEEYGGNDIGRMKTQRNFIMATIKQTVQAKNIFKIKEIIDIAYEYIETNVPISVMKDYVPYAVNVNVDEMQSEYLPGVSEQVGPQKLWVYKVNKTETEKLIKKLYSEDETDEVENTETPVTNNTTTDTNVEKSDASKIKIEILNGSGSDATATKVKKALSNKGYKITKVTTTTTTAKTTIINKTEVDEQFEQDIKNILGVGNISTSSVSSNNVDITIIIGKDYK